MSYLFDFIGQVTVKFENREELMCRVDSAEALEAAVEDYEDDHETRAIAIELAPVNGAHAEHDVYKWLERHATSVQALLDMQNAFEDKLGGVKQVLTALLTWRGWHYVSADLMGIRSCSVYTAEEYVDYLQGCDVLQVPEGLKRYLDIERLARDRAREDENTYYDGNSFFVFYT